MEHIDARSLFQPCGTICSYTFLSTTTFHRFIAMGHVLLERQTHLKRLWLLQTFIGNLSLLFLIKSGGWWRAKNIGRQTYIHISLYEFDT